MKKLIKVTEDGSNRNLLISRDKILHFECLTYNAGKKVSVITLIKPEAPIHVINSLENLVQQFEEN